MINELIEFCQTIFTLCFDLYIVRPILDISLDDIIVSNRNILIDFNRRKKGIISKEHELDFEKITFDSDPFCGIDVKHLYP